MKVRRNLSRHQTDQLQIISSEKSLFNINLNDIELSLSDWYNYFSTYNTYIKTMEKEPQITNSDFDLNPCQFNDIMSKYTKSYWNINVVDEQSELGGSAKFVVGFLMWSKYL